MAASPSVAVLLITKQLLKVAALRTCTPPLLTALLPLMMQRVSTGDALPVSNKPPVLLPVLLLNSQPVSATLVLSNTAPPPVLTELLLRMMQVSIFIAP